MAGDRVDRAPGPAAHRVRVEARRFRIKAGLQKSPGLWKRHNRVRKLRILTSNKTEVVKELPNQRKTVDIDLPKAELVRYVIFEIKSVYRGSQRRANHTCLTQIRPY